MEEVIFCRKCGQRNPENNYQCTQCGYLLHETPKPQHIMTDDSTLGGLIPYKNAYALWAYYLSVFSLIPCVAIPLGFAALICGIKGVRYSKQHPETQGKVHAWIGIILGGLCAAGSLALIVLAIVFGTTNG